MSQRPLTYNLLSAALLSCALPALAQTNQSVVVNWNAAALQEIRLSKLGPPIAAACGWPSRTPACTTRGRL